MNVVFSEEFLEKDYIEVGEKMLNTKIISLNNQTRGKSAFLFT